MNEIISFMRDEPLVMTLCPEEESILLPTPAYLHRKRAFGIWSLPVRGTIWSSRVRSRF